MSHTASLARHDAFTEALRIIDHTLGDEPPSDQALNIIAAIKRARDDKPARVSSSVPRDYMADVQRQARAAWARTTGAMDQGDNIYGPHVSASASVETPIGALAVTVWRQRWAGSRGDRIVWAGEYRLDDEPITVAEIKEAGLAQRPTTRNRQRRSG